MQKGKLPLHHAAANHAEPEVLVALLPASVAAKEKATDSYIVINVFAEYKEELLAVLLADLLAQERVALRPDNGDTKEICHKIAHTFHSWTTLVSETEDTCIHIVKAILNARKDDAQKLAYLHDASGRRAIEM